MNNFIKTGLLVAFGLCIQQGFAQQGSSQLVDQVAAVIGGKIVLQSDVQEHYLEYVSQNIVANNMRCLVFEDLMYQKLLLLEAEKDTTMTVSDAQVDENLNKRMDIFIRQFGGSKEKFEAYYGKTIEQFKEMYRPDIKELLLAQQMRGKITEGITVSPEEIRDFYNSFPKDSIPNINAQVEIAQIVKMPSITEAEKMAAKEKCEKIRQDVINGKSMSVEAVLYSDDPAAQKNSGEYKNVKHNEFVPEFEKVAFSLQDGEISQVFETQFGYHFIQLEHRHGEQVDLRHILIMPKVSPEDLQKAVNQLDSIYGLIKKDSLTFGEAAAKYSDDDNTKYNGGLILNQQTGQPGWDMDQIGQIDPTIAFALNTMNAGDVSTPQQYASPDGSKQGYRLIYLKKRTKPHKENLIDDYQLVQSQALAKKQQTVVHNWISRKLKEGVYVHIDDSYKDCTFQNKWIATP